MERESESVVLRQATLNDMEFLTRAFLVSLREAIETARGSWDEERERTQFERQMKLEHTQVISVDEEDVGFVSVIPRIAEANFTRCVLFLSGRGKALVRSLRGESLRPLSKQECRLHSLS